MLDGQMLDYLGGDSRKTVTVCTWSANSTVMNSLGAAGNAPLSGMITSATVRSLAKGLAGAAEIAQCERSRR